MNGTTDINAAAQQAAMSGNMSTQAAREVSVMLSANTGPYQKEVGAAAKATEALVTALEAADKAYKRALKAIGTWSIGVGGAMQATAVGATYAAGQFEESFARVAKTTGLRNTVAGATGAGADLAAAFGLGDDALQQFENDIRLLSTTIPVGVGELSHLADVAGQLGVESRNLEHFANTAAKLGAGISDLSSDVAIQGLANLSGAFGLAEENVHHLGSALAELANHTRGSADEILYFSQRMAGTAVQVGITADEVLGLGAAVSAIGAQPELGASALIQTITQISRALQSGGDEAERFAQVMGVSLTELQRMWAEQGPTQVILQLLNTLSTQGDKASITLQKLKLSGVGTTQVLGGLAAQIDVVNEAMGMSEHAFEEGTAVADLAAVRFDSLTKKMQQFRQSTSEVFRSMGTGTLVVFKVMVDMVTNLVNIFNELPQPLKTAMGFVAGIGGAALTAAGAFTIFFASLHAFFFLVSVLPSILSAVGKALALLGGEAAIAGSRIDALAAKLGRFGGVLTGLVAAIRTAGAAMRTAFGMAATTALSGLLLVLNSTRKAMIATTRAMAVATWHEWTHALALTGKAFMALGKAVGSVFLTVAKLFGPMILLAGAMWGATKAWAAMKTSVDDLTSSFKEAADAADLLLETMEEIQKLQAQSMGGLRLAVEAEDLLDTLERLDEEERKEHLISYGFQLLRSGNTPEQVQHHIKELGRLSQTPIKFGFTLEDISSGEGFAQALEHAASVHERVRKSVQRTQGEDIFGYGGWFGRTPASTAEYQVEFQQQLEQLAASSNENAAAALSNYLSVAQDLDSALARGEISVHEYNDSLRMLEETLQVVPEASEELRKQIEMGTDLNTDEAIQRYMKSQGMIIDEKSVMSARSTLMRLMETQLASPFERKLQNAVRDAVGQTDDLNYAIDQLSDAQITDLINQFRELAVEANVDEIMDGLDDMRTELGKRMEMPLLTGMPEEEAKRYWDSLKSTFPSEFGLGSAIRQAREELDALIETGEQWGEDADRYRQLLSEWTPMFTEMQVVDIAEELQAVPAEEQVKRLNSELRALGDVPTDIVIQIRAQVLQETFQQESSGFRQEMSKYEQLLQQREDIVESHHDRLADMQESRARSEQDIYKNHNKRMEDIAKQERKALEERADAVTESFDLMEQLESGRSISGGRLLGNIEAQNRAIESMRKGVAQLSSMGLSEEVMQQLGFDDPKNVDQVQRLVEDALANPALIEQINAQWRERIDVSSAFVADTADANEIRERFAEMRADAQEGLNEQLASLNENYARSVGEANEAHEEQMSGISDSLEKLGRTTSETLDELIDAALKSGIDGLAEWARVVDRLRSEIDLINEGAPRGITRHHVRDLNPDVQPEGDGFAWIDRWWTGFKDKAPEVWRNISNDMDHGASTTVAIVEGIFGDGVDESLRILKGLSEQDEVWNKVIESVRTGAGEVKDALHEGLTGNDEDLEEIAKEWIESLENPLDDFLKDLDLKPGGGSGGGPTATAMADGGLLPDQATIQRSGTLIQWAEPETGGEAFIPLAPGKRERSREIWLKTGQLLGMQAAYASGGIRGSEPTGTSQTDIVRALTKALERSGPSASHTTNYGPIEVRANDVKQLVKQLETRRRRDRLTGRQHDA